MKTKFTFRKAPLFVFYILWFFVSALPAFSQCPTITNSNPPPICNASGFTFNDLNTFANDEGDGIVWYDTLTGGTPFDVNTFVQEGTYYADDNSGSCVTRVSINVNFQIDATGQNLDRVYCSNENPIFQTYIDEILQPNTPAGGSSLIYKDINLTDQVNPMEPIGNIVNYLIVFVDASGCESQVETARIIVIDAPDPPTPPNPQMFCADANPTIGDLNPGTTESFNWYARLNGSGDPIFPALNPSTSVVDGRTYYVQVNGISCNSDPVAVTVTINTSVDPGTSASLQFCDDSLPSTDINLFNELAGSPDTTGVWTGPLPISNGNLGTINISSLTAGIYVFTYTVPTTGVCPDGTSTVTINVFQTLSSGTIATGVQSSFCESLLPSNFDLFSLLENEDPGGQWTRGTTSTDPAVISPIDLNGLAPGTYNFTYTQNVMPNPCPENSTTVEITILEDPNAGVAVNQSFCELDLVASSPFDLFNALDGSQDNNLGTWRDANNVVISNPVDISSFTSTDSPYRFNYTLDNGVCLDVEVITITVLESPESGTPVVIFPEFCQGASPTNFDLFTLLEGENQTGIWYIGTDNTGTVTTTPTDLSVLTAGTYNFTYEVATIGACNDELVTVQVIINPIPNTGIANNPAPFCENDAVLNNTSFDLFTLLNPPVDVGGTWTDDDATGTLTGSNVDLTGLAVGSFNFTYSITDANNCSNSTTVIITIDDTPQSGTANTPEEFCISDIATGQTYNLFDLLTDEDQTGIWNDDNATGVLSANTITLNGLAVGTYNFTYNVNAIGSCDDVDITVSIIINPAPNTGTPSPAIFCKNDLAGSTPLDLFGQLTGEDTGGTWTDDDATGTLTGSNVDLTGLAIGSFNFTYSITDANNCNNSTTVIITIDDTPESGTANIPEEFCISDIATGQTYNLFDLLTGEDQTGIWNDDDAIGALSANTITLDGLAVGTYNFTYNVNAIGSCDDVDVTVSIIINDTPSPVANSIQEFCSSATVANLVATGANIQWYDAAIGGTPLADTTLLVDNQDYFATQTNTTTSCESSVRTQVNVNITPLPNAGTLATTPLLVCNNTTINLNDGLDGSQDVGGTWYQGLDTTGTVVADGTMFAVNGFTAGNYQFTYNVSAPPCDDASITITVTVDAPFNPGANNSLNICSNIGNSDLFPLLGGADIGGTWSPTLDSTTGVFNPLIDTAGLYTYSFTNACGSFSSEIMVTVTPAPNAGTGSSVSFCVGDDSVDLFTLLGTDAQTGGTWSPTLTSSTGVFDPAVDSDGVYTYIVSAIAPCSPNAEAQITITINDTPAVTVIESEPSFCLVDNPIVADLAGSINITGTVNWYEDMALTLPLNNDDALEDGEDYYATQTNSSGCESSTSMLVNVTVNDVDTPTLKDTSITFCINNEPKLEDVLSNIVEHDDDLDNIRFYNQETNGSIISSNTNLIPGTTYYIALFDAVVGCESSIRLEYTPDLTDCGELFLPDGFSPNGDGTNDTFNIDNLDIIYPDYQIEIYNRYGNVVYKGTADTPPFDGTSNQPRTLIKGDLPVGVYFYIFNFNDGENKPEQGRLYLSR